jgi:hypothetical protein
MTQGTKSVLFGCHQFLIHPLLVLIAWVKYYRSVPALWQIVCIFLHDVGHIGKQYLDDPIAKAGHWRLGAKIAGKLFGRKGFEFVAGHVTRSICPRSMLYYPDKLSWLISPNVWLNLNSLIEDFGTEASKAENWKRIVAQNVENGFAKGSHELYLEHKAKESINGSILR